MSAAALLQYALWIAVLTLCVKPVGGYLARVMQREPTALDPLLKPVERLIYRLAGVDPGVSMTWSAYALSMLATGFAGTLLVYAVLRLQHLLPFHDPATLTTPMTPDLALNTAWSFATTTTWQAYSGENTMSAFTQLVALAAQGFIGGATGLAVGTAFIRGFARDRDDHLGNFWVDLVRGTLWVLLPAALAGGLFLVQQGVPMTFRPDLPVQTLEGGKQTIALGPVAALSWIENMGTNGGGYFAANQAHPFQNPTPLTNFVLMLAIAVLPAGLTATFGRVIQQPRQGWLIYWVMTAIFLATLLACGWFEQAGSLEGKEVRFGFGGSVLTAVVTSHTSCGSTNASADSFTPLGGMVILVNLLMGEIAYGGLGSGFYSLVMIALVAVFLCGLMIGRTPEYLGRSLDGGVLKIIALYSLIGPACLLPLTALAGATAWGQAGAATNAGPHGLTSIMVAYASCFANNGLSFGGLSANSPFYNLTTAIAMGAGRYLLAISALALAGLIARKQPRPASAGTLPTDTVLFGAAVVATVVLVAAVTYVPMLFLGPLAEHFQAFAARPLP